MAFRLINELRPQPSAPYVNGDVYEVFYEADNLMETYKVGKDLVPKLTSTSRAEQLKLRALDSQDELTEKLNDKVTVDPNKSLVDNPQIEKLEALDTQPVTDSKLTVLNNRIDSAVVQVSGETIPISSSTTVLPQGGSIPSYITTNGKAELLGGVSGKTFTQTGGSSITVSAGNLRYAYYTKSTNLWAAGEESPLPSTPVSGEIIEGGIEAVSQDGVFRGTLKPSDMGYLKEELDTSVNRKVGTALTSAGLEVTATGYTIVSKKSVKDSTRYRLINIIPVASAKFLVFYKADNSIISVTPMTTAVMEFETPALTTTISYTIKAPAESVETTPLLYLLKIDEITSLKDAIIVDAKATKTLETLPLYRLYTLGYILPNTALNSGGINVVGIGYSIINKQPATGDTDYIVGGVRESVTGSKYVSQYNALGVHISTTELKELPFSFKSNVNTRFISYTIETPPETDGYGTANNYIGKPSLFLSDVIKSKWNGLLIRTFGDSITWYDRRNFGATHVQAGQIVVGYQSYMRNLLGCTVDNRGESGYDMTQISTIIRGISDYSGVSACTITSGANDSRKGITLGSITPIGSAFNAATFYGALQAGIEHILAANPVMKIYLMTPINGWFKESGTTAVPGPYKGVMNIHPDFVNAIKEIGQLYSLPVLDWYYNSQINKLNKGQYIGDNSDQPYDLHPTNEGYKLMGELLVTFLK